MKSSGVACSQSKDKASQVGGQEQRTTVGEIVAAFWGDNATRISFNAPLGVRLMRWVTRIRA